MNLGRARVLREMIVKASASLPDTDAVQAVELFPVWQADTDYIKDQRVRDGDQLYRLIPEKHHSQSDWPPHLVPSIWARIDDPSVEWPDWVQPLGSEDAYKDGAKVTHKGKHWTNTFGNGNVWEPGVFGWTEQP